MEAEISATHGSIQFVSDTRNSGIKVGGVSSAAPWMVERVLSKLDLQNSFLGAHPSGCARIDPYKIVEMIRCLGGADQ